MLSRLVRNPAPKCPACSSGVVFSLEGLGVKPMARIHRPALHGEHGRYAFIDLALGHPALVVKAALLEADQVLRGIEFRVIL